MGGSGDDLLDGGRGVDVLRGGAGNDTYIVDHADEIARGVADAGQDVVKARVTYALGTFQEQLVLTGVAAINGTGNGQANVLIGNNRANRLDGGAGADVVRGAGGNDVLIYDARDSLMDGGAGQDRLRFKGAGRTYELSNFRHVSSIEILDIRGSGANALTIDGQLASRLPGDGVLRVLADGDDYVEITGAWQSGIFNGIDGGIYDEFKLGQTTLYVPVATSLVVGGIVPLENAFEGVGIHNTTGIRSGNGYAFRGEHRYDNSGSAVSGLGDINGDGLDDIIIGAYRADPHGDSSGASYVVFGATGGFEQYTELSSLDGAQGFSLDGHRADARSGGAVSGAGDFNADGFDDVLVGASRGAQLGSYAGVSYLLFGAASGFAAQLTLDTMDAGQGFRLDGSTRSESGSALSGAGDINGDGYDDILIGAYGFNLIGDYAGAGFVVFGRDAPVTTPLDLSGLDGANGFRLEGVAAGDMAGRAIAAAGDVNGDGFGDLIIGAEDVSQLLPAAGAAYVVFGAASGFEARISLGSLNGNNGFSLHGGRELERVGTTVSGVGDFNGDGFDDVLVGGDGRGEAGVSYLVFGAASGLAADLGPADLNGTNGLRLLGAAGDASGSTVAGVGDVNGDGFDDLLIAAPNADFVIDDGGGCYVLFGTDQDMPASFNLAALDGVRGLRIGSLFSSYDVGVAASAAGDVNGDGYDDILIGAPKTSSPGVALSGAETGASYVVYGRDFGGAVAREGTPGDDTLTGTAGGETLVGGRGNDILDGGGGADSVQAGAGDDVLIWHAGMRQFDGGSGTDVLRVDGAGELLDLTTLPDHFLEGIERIELTGSGDNGLQLALHDVLALPDHAGHFTADHTYQLLIDGNVGDSVSSSGWTQGSDIDIHGTQYRTYTHAGTAAQLFIDVEVTQNVV